MSDIVTVDGSQAADSRDSVLSEGKELFEMFADADRDNRAIADEDTAFIEDDEAQWPAEVLEERRDQNLPCLTANRLKPIARQVVNDMRQNRPSIKVSPADSQADPDTAEIIAGLIRNIEYTSNAEAAYDTAGECAVIAGVGYLRVDIDYAYDDSFDLDLKINRIPNRASVYRDVNSTASDSSDWNDAFVVEEVTRKDYERRFNDNNPVSWDVSEWRSHSNTWLDDDKVLIAEWWNRTEVEKPIVQLSNGWVFEVDRLLNDPDLRQLLFMIQIGQIQVVNERMIKSHKVVQRIMSGAEILEEVNWPGKYIPIVPVFGDEYWLHGKRHYRGLLHHAKDSQRMLNYWQSQSTALTALAPRSPWLMPDGAQDADPSAWETANTRNHPYLVYGQTVDGQWVPPQRQPLDGGVAAGALQQAAQASQDIHHTTGIYPHNLGESQGPEQSGRAIRNRIQQGDKGTYHFIDNLNRAIRHTGRILVDLIPHIYTNDRVIRIMGKDGSHENVPLGQPMPKKNPQTGQPMMQQVQQPDGRMYEQPVTAIHDLSVGKYDVTVDTGPSYQTQRQEAAEMVTSWLQAYPQGAPMMVDILAKNQDWPGADEIAERFKAMLPPPLKGGPDPQVMQLQQQLQQGAQYVQILQREVENLKAQLKDKQTENYIKNRGADIDAYEAVTERMEKAAQVDDLARQRAQENMAMAAARYRPPMPPQQPPMSRPPVPGSPPNRAPQRPQGGPMAAPPMRPPQFPPRG